MCYCDAKKDYHQCCYLIHQDHNQAQTALELMRARYSAFALKKIDFLLKTQQGYFSKQDIQELNKFVLKTDFYKLKVLSFTNHSLKEAYVEFKAFYKIEHQTKTLREKSKFTYLDNKWFYMI